MVVTAPLRPGDRVQWLDEALEGQVLEVSPTAVLVRTTEGFEISVPQEALVRIPDAPRLSGPPHPQPAKEEPRKSGKRRQRSGKKQRFAPVMEVDLHIEKLVPDPSGLSPYEMLDRQLNAARGQLEFALRKRIQRLVFIHGVGEGVLKEELYTLLRRYDGVRFSEADYRTYGQGATEVFIPQELFG